MARFPAVPQGAVEIPWISSKSAPGKESGLLWPLRLFPSGPAGKHLPGGQTGNQKAFSRALVSKCPFWLRGFLHVNMHFAETKVMSNQPEGKALKGGTGTLSQYKNRQNI